MDNLEVFVSAGEPSGDLHASHLIEHCQKIHGMSFRGFGGPLMGKSGCNLDFKLTEMAVVGIVEVLPKLREFFRIADIASEIFEKSPPAAVLLIDFPGFNWHIAKRAKQHGIPVYYYLPPQLWAWGSWRIKKMRKYVDHVICNLPFEYDWYQQKEMPSTYVGHPFFDEVATSQLDENFTRIWSSADAVKVAVLPGSRNREIKTIWPMQLAAIRELASKHPKAQFLVACLKQDHLEKCMAQLTAADKVLNLHFFVGKTSEIIEIADCALMKSGSVSLEMMARNTPAAVVYQIGRTTYTLMKPVFNLKSITLPNLIAGKTIFPEFLAVGKKVDETIASSVEVLDRLIASPAARDEQKLELQQVCEVAGKTGATARAAHFLAEQLGRATSPKSGSVKAA